MASCGVFVFVLILCLTSRDIAPPAVVAPDTTNALQAVFRLCRAAAEDHLAHGDAVDVGAADRDPGLVRDVQNGAVVAPLAPCVSTRSSLRSGPASLEPPPDASPPSDIPSRSLSPGRPRVAALLASVTIAWRSAAAWGGVLVVLSVLRREHALRHFVARALGRTPGEPESAKLRFVIR